MTSTEDMPEQSSEGELERHPDWERIADGRPWRLKRGRDFDYSVKRLRVEANLAAEEMSKVVTHARDAVDSNRYVWLQFADALVLAGRPCPRCNGDHLQQMSGQFARCVSCGAQLIVKRLPNVEDVELRMREAAHEAGRTDETLSAYRRVHLSLAEADESNERFIGYGFDEEGRFTLLYVVAPLAGGRRIPDESSPTGFLHTLGLAVAEPFGDIVDVSGLLDKQLDGWDIAIQ